MAVERHPMNPWILLTVAVFVALGGSPLHALSTSDVETGVKVHRVFNFFEGLLWGCLGVVLIWKSRSLERVRSPMIFAGVTFILFGVSDFIEIRTGSWFEPIWLLIWNVTCVVSLVSSLLWYLALRRKRGP